MFVDGADVVAGCQQSGRWHQMIPSVVRSHGSFELTVHPKEATGRASGPKVPITTPITTSTVSLLDPCHGPDAIALAERGQRRRRGSVLNDGGAAGSGVVDRDDLRVVTADDETSGVLHAEQWRARRLVQLKQFGRTVRVGSVADHSSAARGMLGRSPPHASWPTMRNWRPVISTGSIRTNRCF